MNLQIDAARVSVHDAMVIAVFPGERYMLYDWGGMRVLGTHAPGLGLGDRVNVDGYSEYSSDLYASAYARYNVPASQRCHVHRYEELLPAVTTVVRGGQACVDVRGLTVHLWESKDPARDTVLRVIDTASPRAGDSAAAIGVLVEEVGGGAVAWWADARRLIQRYDRLWPNRKPRSGRAY